jgi:DNA-binding FadR family transcriptional regulator
VAELDFQEARQVLEARHALEPAAIARAAVRRTDSDIAGMTAALDDLLAVTRKWGETALAAHRGVHEALYRSSHNASIRAGRTPEFRARPRQT